MELDEKLSEQQTVPGYHGTQCPANGSNPAVECGCEECDDFLTCFPDWKDRDFFDKVH